ncbi:nucleoside deaminase [Streptosporangium sp. NBC_01810]|uniref:nucleoside deaminase n=1 Tax=Streptosporangium sp. NBC_01810 TaxID=2975951 RepID=UPI002DD855B7|nr:nucleoside deaminase [Streptosporangium sp. NBC_01810]WSA25799.1 nucleoside deaminase [Streptosporangium sp. NBC_01810]
MITETDLRHLRRCVDLAAEALDAGDEPFGSVLADPTGEVLLEERNRVNAVDRTRHPELAIVRWAAANLSPEERAAVTVYTSGEHCPMCAAAHALVGLGRIVYATSRKQLSQWRTECGAPPSPVSPLPIQAVAPGVRAEGPVEQYVDEVRALHRRLMTHG